MAERSKAPDSRLIAFPSHNVSGRSGLRMEAWVRIPLLTMSLFMTIFLSVSIAVLVTEDSSYESGIQVIKGSNN